MFRKTLLAAAAIAAFGGFAAIGAGNAQAQGTGPGARQGTAVATMQPGQRVQLGPMLGERRVRMVMIAENGNTIDLVYDDADPRTRTQSQRVLRLENVNGMLEVVYDTAAPTMVVGSGGRVSRVEASGGGMIEITYAPR
jgi:hypothetical protein